jgi:hypothetical protein
LDVRRRPAHLRRAQDHEQGIVVDLELRPLVRVVGVLDGQVVQVELALDLAQQLLPRLVHADPDEPPGRREHLSDVRHLDIGDADAALVGGAVDDAAAQTGAGRRHPRWQRDPGPGRRRLIHGTRHD